MIEIILRTVIIFTCIMVAGIFLITGEDFLFTGPLNKTKAKDLRRSVLSLWYLTPMALMSGVSDTIN